MTVSFDLLMENYAKTIGSKTILNLNIDRALSKEKIDISKRKYTKKLDHKFQKEYTTTFVIPAGYKVTSVPKPIKYDGKDYGFSISYEETAGKIIQHKNIYINTLRIEKEAPQATHPASYQPPPQWKGRGTSPVPARTPRPQRASRHNRERARALQAPA